MFLGVDNKETVRFFSEFLNKTARIVKQIKTYVFEFVNISTPLNQKCNEFDSNISTILSHSSKVYDDLKKIEAILSGLRKSKLLNQNCYINWSEHQQIKSLNKVRTSKSLSCLASKNRNNEEIPTFTFLNTYPNNTHPYPKSKNSSQRVEIKEEIEITESSDEESYNKRSIFNQISKTSSKKCITLPNSSQKMKNYSKNSFAQKIESVLSRNRQRMNTALERNSQCIRMIKSVKKAIESKF